MKEEWKPIKGYEGLYELRNDGLIHCLPRKYTKDRYTFGNCNNGGYLQYVLSYKQKKVNKKIHILVYETFVGPVPKGYDVHHKNHNRQDNRVENLELIEKIDHCKNHYKEKQGKMTEGTKKVLSKPIVQYTLDGEFVAEYPSAMEAERQTGMFNSYINACLRGRKEKAYNFVWKYKEAA